MRSVAAAVGFMGVIALGVWAALASEPEREIASYVTCLEGRTDSQKFNADLALKKINGTLIQPGRLSRS